MKKHYLVIILAISLAGCKKNQLTEHSGDLQSKNHVGQNIGTFSVNSSRELTDYQVDSIADAHNTQLNDAMSNINWSADPLKDEVQQAFQSLWNSGMPVSYETYCTYFPANPKRGLDSVIFDTSFNNPSDFYKTYYDVLSYVSEGAHSNDDIADYIDSKSYDVKSNQIGSDIDRSLIFLETTKKSAYFWLPNTRGGSGIGYGYIHTWFINNDIDPDVVLAAPTLGGVMCADGIGATRAWIVIGLCLCPTPVTLGAIAAVVGGGAAWDSFMYIALSYMFE